MGLTVDALYEAFMDMDTDDPTPFAEDIYDFMNIGNKLGDKGWGRDRWARDYGMYLPTWDPSQVNLAERERGLAYRNAMDTLKVTEEVTDRVYTTEVDTLSTSLGKELDKGRELASRTGIRSGNVESAIQDTVETAGFKVKDLSDRMMITEEDTKNKYNSAMVEGALDFAKTERDEKEEFYDRTMATIMRLTDLGAFGEGPYTEGWFDQEAIMEGVMGGTCITANAMACLISCFGSEDDDCYTSCIEAACG